MRTLAIRRDVGIGDIIMLTPALRALHESGEWDAVDVFCRDDLRCLLEHNSRVRNVHPDREFMRRRGEYSEAVDLLRVPECHPDIHTRSRPELYAEALGVSPTSWRLEYTVASGELLAGRHIVEGLPDPVVAFAPMASDPKRSLASAQIVRFAYLARAHGVPLVALHHTDYLAQHGCWQGHRTLWGANLRLVAALLTRVAAVVSVDTGILHLALAVGDDDWPSLVLPFTATDPHVLMRPHSRRANWAAVAPREECVYVPCATGGAAPCQALVDGEPYLCRSSLMADDIWEALEGLL